MKTVLITGATGFIARYLAPMLQREGMRVVGTSRSVRAMRGFDRVYGARLGDSLAPILAEERIDVIVHAALDAGADAYAVNVNGTTRWLEEAQAAGVSLQILLSTLSATPEARSDYGRAKYVLEQRFYAAHQVAFRLGVVIGDGGMFARLRESARRFPIVPMLDGGAQHLYVLGIDYLCAVLRDCVVRDGAGLRGRGWNLHMPRAYTLREVMAAICRSYGYRRLLLPIPAAPILRGLRLVERLFPFIKLPVTSDNVEGLIQQGRQEISTDFARFGYPEQSLDRLVIQARADTSS